jgi:chromatin segregation and condensation protein Rec8/ScpA/Scc1 (kleisin family)
MVREGVIELHQNTAFAPIYLRKRATDAAPPGSEATSDGSPPSDINQ